MDTSEDLKSWAKKQKLAPEVVAILEENGFTTVDDLAGLTPEDIKTEFKDSGLLNLAQYLALKRAVTALSQPHTPHPPSITTTGTPPPPYSTPPPGAFVPQPFPYYPPQAQPYPYNPQPYHLHSYPQPAHPRPYPSPNQPHHSLQPLSYPQTCQPHPQPYLNGPGLYPAMGGDARPSLASAPSQGPSPFQPQARDVPSGGHPLASAGQPSRSGDTPGAHAMDVDDVPDMAEVSECFRFLLLGKTGSGKSTTGNTIFGEHLFNTAATFASVTSDCERKTNTRGGRKIEILDSPGLYDTHKTQEEIGVVIVQAVAGMHPGPHAILYVVRLGRYTAEEHGAYQRLKALFDDAISRYLIVVFTGGDQLERHQQTIEDLIGPNSPKSLRKVLQECHNRYIVFNNMAADPRPQVEQLLMMVRVMMKENGDLPYSCPKYANIGQGMEEEVARRLQEVEKRDLKRQKYVQQLEQQTKEAEETARRTQEEFQKNEEERQRRMEEEEERRRLLEEQLQDQIKEKQIGFEKFQQELENVHRQREEQERMMKEREAQMTEMERKRAEEQAERMRQQELEMAAKLEEQQERLQRQKQEDAERRQAMERERQEFLQQMEDQRREEREEMKRKEEERERLWEEKRQDERRAARRHEEEMEKLKTQMVETQRNEFFNSLALAVRGFIGLMAEVGKQMETSSDKDDDDDLD